MADKTVTISNPVLQSGEYFKVEYKLSTSTSWTLHGYEDNTPFVISGLTSGVYELRVTMFTGSPAVDCGSFTYQFDVVEIPECECPSNIQYTAVRNIVNNMITVSISCDTPEPPNQGFIYNVYDYLGNNIASTSSPIPSLNGVTFSFLDNGNAPFTLSILVWCDTLNGVLLNCFEEDMEVTEGECTPISVSSSDIIILNNQTYLRISFTNSNPATQSVTVSYVQTDTVFVGSPDFGSLLINPVSSPIMIPIMPNNIGIETWNYDWVFYDVCGNKHSGTAHN